MLINYPIVVVGPPRSGTTTTARILQEWFGVLMDGDPLPPHKVINPDAWYEDRRLANANIFLGYGWIGLKAWTRRFKRFIRQMERQSGGQWGFKDPRIIPLLNYALSFLPSATVVRCHRKSELVVNSMMKKLGWTKEFGENYLNRAENTLDTQLKNRVHYRIDFGDERTQEEQIIDFFTDGLMIRKYAA